jgi:hypothetical protein
MEIEFKCKCGKPAAFFYKRNERYERLFIYDDANYYWNTNFLHKDKNIFDFACLECCKNLVTVERLLGRRPRLLLSCRSINGYNYFERREREYFDVCERV